MSRSLVWVTRPNCGKTAPGWCLLDLFRWDGLHFFNRICLSQSRFWFFLTDKNRPTREQKQWEVDDKVSLENISFWIVTLRHELWPFLNWFQLLKVTNCRHLNMYYLLEIFPLKPKIFVTNIIPSEVSVDLVQSAVNTSSPSASQAWPWLWFGFLSTSKPLRWLPSGGWQSKILDRTPARWVNSEISYIENMANLAKLPYHNCMSQISEVFLFVEKNYYQVEADIEDQIAVHHFLQVLGEAIIVRNQGCFFL